MAHTSGPWRPQYKSDGARFIVARHGPNNPVAELFVGIREGRLDFDRLDADAALIAAAPDLLDILERVTNQLKHADLNDELWVEARAILRKARGEE